MTYEEEKKAAELRDAELGFDIAGTEARVSAAAGADREALWLHVPPSTFLTPYTELKRMLEVARPRDGALIADLGAGYGRMAFVIKENFPGLKFTGYEISRGRVNEAKRVFALHGIDPESIACADLRGENFHLPEADLFFIYDFGPREAIAKILGDLREMAMRRPICVIGRGRATRDAIERQEPWLSQIVQPQHHGNFSLYFSG